MEVRRNQDFVGIGSRASHACLVMDGLTARWGNTRDGQRQITALHVAGDMPDLYSLMLPQVTFGIAVRMAVMSIVAGNDA